MRWSAIATLATAAGLVACAPELDGPAAPIAREQFADTAAPALEASSARATVISFVEAYAASPTDGAAPLARLVAGPELGAWVRWLDVQHREFTGTIGGRPDLRDVEFIQTLVSRNVTGAQVGLSATVTFAYAPVDAGAFERSRILDGPVTLVHTETGGFLVLDLLRDGVPMSDGIQLFEDERRTDGSVTVRIDSLFMFAPNWQFNVEVANASGTPMEIEPEASGLLIGPAERAGIQAGAVTGSLQTVDAGTEIDGILAVPLQEDATARTLVLTYRAGQELLRFDFPLEDIVDAVPTTAPATAVALTDTTGATG